MPALSRRQIPSLHRLRTADINSRKDQEHDHFRIALTPLISLIAGVLILVMPRLLNYIVAIYLIIAGLLGLFPHLAG